MGVKNLKEIGGIIMTSFNTIPLALSVLNYNLVDAITVSHHTLVFSESIAEPHIIED